MATLCFALRLGIVAALALPSAAVARSHRSLRYEGNQPRAEVGSAKADIDAAIASGDERLVRMAALQGEAAGLQAEDLIRASKYLNDRRGEDRKGLDDHDVATPFGLPSYAAGDASAEVAVQMPINPEAVHSSSSSSNSTSAAPELAAQMPISLEAIHGSSSSSSSNGTSAATEVAAQARIKWETVHGLVDWLINREQREREAIASMSSTEPSEECRGTECGWTQSWSCPGQPRGSNGTAVSDGSMRFACCCVEAMWQQLPAYATISMAQPTVPDVAADQFAVPVLSDSASAAAEMAAPASKLSALVVVHCDDDAVGRASFRESFRSAKLGKSFVLKFATCEKSLSPLDQQGGLFGDIMPIECPEGGMRSDVLKQLAVMKIYRQNHRDHLMLMQIHDDTFVAWHRLSAFLSERAAPADALFGGAAPDAQRDVSEHSYIGMPVWQAEGASFFQYMGDAVFILGRALVKDLLDRGFAQSALMQEQSGPHLLGMWVDMVKRTGGVVNYVPLPGDVGDNNTFNPCGKQWKDYPYVFQRLPSEGRTQSMACLSSLDRGEDPAALFDGCLPQCATASSPFGR